MMEVEATPIAAICCMCASSIAPNPANMCLQCLRTQVNITSSLSTRITMYQCRGCLKYMGGSGGTGWGHYEMESRELLAVCLKKINGLSKLRLIDAAWIWTEPHSKRLKVKLTVQKEVMNGAVLQEAIIIEYVVRNMQCPDCQASYTTGAWKCIVQVRQRVDHKRTFLHLEQLILKHHAHAHALQIQAFKDGMDFYYAERNQVRVQGSINVAEMRFLSPIFACPPASSVVVGARFTEFLETVCPCSVKYSKKLVSQDDHSNTFNYKYTSVVEIVPVCKDDLVILPTRLAQNLGDIARLCLVHRVSNHVHFVDPVTCQVAELSVDKYYRQEFRAVLSASRLVEFMVLGWEPALAPNKTSAPQRKTKRQRLAEVEIARTADLGHNDTRFRVLTHLGHILRAGDLVLGYDLVRSSLNCDAAEELERKKGRKGGGLPDVVLVRKVYSRDDHGKNARQKWRLKNLDELEEMEVVGERDTEGEERDLRDYRQQLEADSEMRKSVNLYRVGEGSRGKGAAAMEGTKAPVDEEEEEEEDEDEEDEEAIKLDELLDDLELDDATAGPDGEAQILAGTSGFANGAAGFTFQAPPYEGTGK